MISMIPGKNVHAEISVIPLGKGTETSMSKEIAAAFDAISKVKGIRSMLTPMGTQIESESIDGILKVIEVAHRALKLAGAKRIISNIRIDERLDKSQTLEDRVNVVENKRV